MRIILLFLAMPIMADPQIVARGFKLIDQVCVEVESEPVILQSETSKRAKEKSLNFSEAQKELINERLLWVMTKKQMKYNVAEIKKSAESHAEKIMKDNHWDTERFAKVLRQPPYEMSIDQFVRQTEYSILEHHVRAALGAQVSVSDAEVADHVNKKEVELKNAFDVVFIMVSADKSDTSEQLSPQFKIANEINKKITVTTTLDELKKQYKNVQNISFIGPLAYQKGELQKVYEEQLAKELSVLVTKPFKDDKAVTMIWKLKKPVQKLDKNALENLRKELYEKRVNENFTAELRSVMGTSTVTMKDCGK